MRLSSTTRILARLAAAIVLTAALGACGGNICWDDHSGLDPPPLGSSIPGALGGGHSPFAPR